MIVDISDLETERVDALTDAWIERRGKPRDPVGQRSEFTANAFLNLASKSQVKCTNIYPASPCKNRNAEPFNRPDGLWVTDNKR